MHNALIWFTRIHLHDPLVWLSIIAGLLAGALWLYASTIKVPTNLVSGWDGWVGGLPEMSGAFKSQATWNGYAAAMTALAAILQALAQLIPS